MNVPMMLLLVYEKWSERVVVLPMSEVNDGEWSDWFERMAKAGSTNLELVLV